MNNSDTYITDHPIIKEISIGDQFELNSGKIVTFDKYDKNDAQYPFKMIDINNLKISFSRYLKFDLSFENYPFDIKYKIIPLKDKLEML